MCYLDPMNPPGTPAVRLAHSWIGSVERVEVGSIYLTDLKQLLPRMV